MVGATSTALSKIAAWPIDLLVDREERVRGFVMPRIAARRDIHELYSPKSRAEAFPETDFRFLVHVAANIARAFAVIHAYGHVVGDVNHGNLLVGPDGTVMLIDCDSFQVGQGPTAFPCDVGVPLFTAPELHGKTFRGLIRTSNHDLFGLAVLLFHLLYMGRHPFAGRFLGHGDMPIEKAVAEYRFAYGPDRKANQMERPPGTLSLEAMGTTISDLFVRTFEREATYGGRPSAEKWVHALAKLEHNLCVCSSVKWHHYLQDLPVCPWCTVEKQTGVRLFGQRLIADRFTGTIDVGALWNAISRVQGPGPMPRLPSELSGQPSNALLNGKSDGAFRQFVAIAFVFGGIAACNSMPKNGSGLWGLAGLVLAYAIWPKVSSEKRRHAEHTVSITRADWDSLLDRWNREASELAFLAKLSELERAKQALVDLSSKRQDGIRSLERDRHNRQLERYLDRFRIDRASIPGIGPSRTAMLASYGIETAEDVRRDAIRRIPGFGSKLAGELLAWRRQHENNFRFNPNEPINAADIEALDRDLEGMRTKLLHSLQQGPEQLRRLSSEIATARTRLMPLLDRSWHNLQDAEAALRAL